jgi:hypothetical protein
MKPSQTPRLGKKLSNEGHGFSRAVNWSTHLTASAAEVRFSNIGRSQVSFAAEFAAADGKDVPQGLWMTAKLMSGSVCFEPISKSALYQGTTSVVPKRGQ